MTQNLNAAKWYKIIFFLIALNISIVLWAWVSGYIYLEISGLNGADALPWTLYQYWYYYGHMEATKLWIIISCICGLGVVSLPFLLCLIPKTKPLYGNAKWASHSDIVKAGLYAENGIVVGQKSSFLGLSKKFLVYGGSQHVLMSAPTRSGKGVSVVIPTLLSWRGSAVIIDLKQENWDVTSGFRAAHGQECFFLNFAPRGENRTHRWNPLYYVSDDPAFRINDIQKIGGMLFPDIEGQAPIWQASARSLWLGIVLYLFETENMPCTMGEALRQITMGDERLGNILEERQKSDNPLSNECYLALKDYLDTPEKLRGSVSKGVTSALEVLQNPIIDAATAGNDFDLRDLRKKPMSVYVVITPDDLERLSPLVNLFFKQVI